MQAQVEQQPAQHKRQLVGTAGFRPHAGKVGTWVLTARYRAGVEYTHEDLEVAAELVAYVLPWMNLVAAGLPPTQVRTQATSTLRTLEASARAQPDRDFVAGLRTLMNRLTLLDGGDGNGSEG